MTIDNIPVQNFELDRYLGTWYEIARFPHSFEKDLVGVSATYSLRENGKIKVVNAGYKNSLKGAYKTITGKAKKAGKPEEGYLKVSFFLFFYADYRILELDTADYQYALVGSGSENTLWILSRTPEMPESVYDMLVERAAARGYDVKRLMKVEQLKLGEFDRRKTI
jgi:lipocalin